MDNPSLQSTVFVYGGFDNLKTPQIRFLQEASRFGKVHVLLFSDQVSLTVNGKKPDYLESERRYYLESIRYVSRLSILDSLVNEDEIPNIDVVQKNDRVKTIWAVMENQANPEKKDFYQKHNLRYKILSNSDLLCFPDDDINPKLEDSKRKKVIVTGCFDWVHSGHIRFFEEVSAFGDLFVVVGHDQNLKLLKGEDHPLYSQDERRYWVQSIRFVKQALVSSGHGWLDAEPEILKIRPDIYAVNEDGDKPEKRKFCLEHNIDYRVLKRIPKSGLPARVSSDLRGF
jgi:cytidyltransferase-like protein